jgi:16S rRNA (cytosine967-C5)-methyltransferase
VSVTPARRVAYKVIRRVFEDGAYADRALHGAVASAGLTPRDRAFATILSYGTVQRRRTLDHLIDSFSTRPASRLDPGARAALELGMFQIALLDGVADHAAVHDSVELVKGEAGGHGAARLVNAVLRAATVDARARLDHLDDLTPAAAAILHSVPDWLAELFFAEFPSAEARRLLAACNRPAESAVRINALAPPAQELAWTAPPPWVGPLTRGAPALPEARVLDGPLDLFGTPQWAAGEVIGQSRASMLVAATLDPPPGQRVLDLCAAPGAKTTHLAARMGAVGEIVAVEVHPGRAAALTRTAQRTRSVNVRVHVGDGRRLGEIGSFDRVLVDPPCSGLGTLAARPDIRWRPRLQRLDSLTGAQTALLEAGAGRTRPGGRLVYSVCTLHRAESETIVDTFLAGHPDWRERSRRTTLPHLEGTDGFFIAELERG